MTENTLHASASSLLLFDEEQRHLCFEVAEGKAGESLKNVKIPSDSGIAGWVARHGRPVVINDVLDDRRFSNQIDRLTGFETRSVMCVPLLVHGKTIGVLEVLNRTDGKQFQEKDLEALLSVAATAAMAIENARLHQNVLDSYKSTIKALASAVDAKDHYTRGHSQRVMEYALIGGASLSLSVGELETIEYAGILHDIGKIGVADSILSKPGRLTEDEWKVVRRHPETGAKILSSIPFLADVKELVLHHHERYDGGGYPHGLRKEEIPIGSRLLSVADSFDTITTDRSYRAARSVDYALEELARCCGSQFCPVAVAAFVSGFAKNGGKRFRQNHPVQQLGLP
ncbi:MAG: GAF domain-containing protein [Chloroflexi bacterium]|nr:GAF domain-containing protein [Chloroflexota bacterium]